MQTIQIQVDDNKLDTFLNYVDNLKDGIVKKLQVQSDTTLDSSTTKYLKTEKFQEDKEYFQNCLEDIQNGKTKCLSQNEYDTQMNDFTNKLKSKYANN